MDLIWGIIISRVWTPTKGAEGEGKPQTSNGVCVSSKGEDAETSTQQPEQTKQITQTIHRSKSCTPLV